jgi:uncharacterized protein (TIGR02270 family)
LLDHPQEDVRESALVAALAWRSHSALSACASWALDANVVRSLPMALYASLGGPAQHERLVKKLALPAHRPAALFALGFSGNPAVLPALLARLSDPSPVVAKIAAQAVATIVGIDLQDAAFIATEPAPAARPEASQPPNEDSPDADIVPAPEDTLPSPNADAIRRFCEERRSSLVPGKRYLGGRETQREVVLDWLEHAPLRRRHVVALALAIEEGGTFWLDTRAFAEDQRRRLAVARANDPR